MGFPNEGNSCYGYNNAQAATWCNTEAYVKRVNAAGWCGAKDWRMPTRQELFGLVDLSVPYPGPTIDTGYFPDTGGQYYWSSSPYALLSEYALSVGFFDGSSSLLWRINGVAVRLVRGGQ